VQSINIAIDGPAGAGKSTLSRKLAQKLQYIYVDTGALYRAVGLHIERHGADPADAKAVETLLPSADVRLTHEDGSQRVLLGGEDVTQLLHTPLMSHYSSCVSAIPAVRAFLLQLQRRIAAAQNVVMDGRDIGTVVLPHAQIKIFLTATAEDRAMRRFEELRLRDPSATYEQVLADMRERDARDTNRKLSPLRQAEDAVLLDTTGNTFEQSFLLLESTVKERLQNK